MRNLANHLPESSGFDLKHLLVEPGGKISLRKDFDPKYTIRIFWRDNIFPNLAKRNPFGNADSKKSIVSSATW